MYVSLVTINFWVVNDNLRGALLGVMIILKRGSYRLHNNNIIIESVIKSTLFIKLYTDYYPTITQCDTVSLV